MNQVNSSLLLNSIIFSFPVLFFCFVLCPYKNPENLLILFIVEWFTLVFLWNAINPNLNTTGLKILSFSFILPFFASSFIVKDNFLYFGSFWNGSDDFFYLNLAKKVAYSLQTSGWNFFDAWIDLISFRYQGWTILGWPFLLGLVSSFFVYNPQIEILHSISLSLNAFLFSLTLSVFLRILYENSKLSVKFAIFAFFLLSFEPIVYAGLSLKETLLQFSLIFSFFMIIKIYKNFKLSYIFFLIAGLIVISTTRPFYIIILIILTCFIFFEKFKFNFFVKILTILTLSIIFSGLVLNVKVRESSIGDRIANSELKAAPGIGMQIYNVPVIGPTIFYALSPIPTPLWKISKSKLPFTTILRSLGSTFWILSLCYVFFAIFKTKDIIKNTLFINTLIIFIGIFFAAVIASNDPRYKLPSNVFLSIMLYLSFCYQNVSAFNKY